MENKKVFSGSKPVVMQITNCINRLKEVSNIIELSEKNPEVFLTNQLFENYLEAQYILNNTYAYYGEQALQSFHIDFIQKVLNILKTNLPFDDLKLETIQDEDGYFIITIYGCFLNSEIPIINLYPYFKKYETLPYEELIQLEKQESEKLDEVNEYKERISFLQECYSNPALYADGNVKLFIKMSNKKQKESILNEDLNRTNIGYQIAKNELLNIQDEINQIKDTLTSIYISRDRYIERLKNRYNYTPIFQEETMEEESSSLFYDSIEKNSENENFFQNMIEEPVEIEYF